MRYYLDTNIFLRLYLGDNLNQLDEVKKLFIKSKENRDILFVTLETLIEFEYVLRKVYKQEKSVVLNYLKSILSTDYLKITEGNIAKLALSLFEACNVDFVDCLLFAKSKENDAKVVSFDRDFKTIQKVYSGL